MRSTRLALSIVALSVLLDLGASARADSLGDALKGGKLSLQLRPRYEFVQQDGKPDDAHAFTMRTLLGYRSKPRAGIGATLQFINVANLGGHRQYNDTANGLLQYPVVADPEITAVNQAFLSYAGLPASTLKLGRQIIVLDNARFIGNVDWRQNMQTYDGASIENKSLPKTALFAAYLTRVKGSYANFQTPVGQNLQPVRILLLHAATKALPDMMLAGFSYLYQDRSQPEHAPSNLSNAITGVRLDGASPLGRVTALYTAEYAKQLGYGGGRSGINARYWHLGGGASLGGVYGRFDYEVLSANADASYGFQTPLATKHAFNGWADMFLATPADGLKDAFATLGATLAGVQLSAVYHDYHADKGGAHFGNEWNFLAVRPLGKDLQLGAKYADYHARDGRGSPFPGTLVPNVNTRKAWVFAIYNY